MDYTGTGGSAALAAGGTLAYTGAGDVTVWLVLGLLLFVLGTVLVIVAARRNRGDARAAGVTTTSRKRRNDS